MRPGSLCLVLLSFIIFSAILMPAFSEDFAFVDLKPYANSNIIDTQWWTGNPGGSDLEELVDIARNGHEFEGPGGEKVQFKVEDANLRIFGTNSAGNPKEIKGIKVGMQAKTVYFLHMTGWEAMGLPSYKFVMNYDDGSKEELLIESGVSSDDWCHVPTPLSDKNSAWVWQESGVTCGTVGVIATKWDNPHSGKRIKTIDVISLETGAVPGIFGITLGGAVAAVSPGGKLTATWARLKAQ